ncbi:thioredoxin-dependent thiol peroxidase [bacterium]|nr:thioredoxin-dependent thiol peroxidase [bacterium]
MTLKTGQTAPEFCLPDTGSHTICLSQHRGRWIVVYFYPKDNTSGCTLEAVQFTRAAPEFDRRNAVILGISPDSVESHCRFTDKHRLGITLLSDTGHSVCDLYGVWALKKMAGKSYHGVVRSTFLIDPAGKIDTIWTKVKVAGHVQEVLDQLNTSSGGSG